MGEGEEKPQCANLNSSVEPKLFDLDLFPRIFVAHEKKNAAIVRTILFKNIG